MYNKELLDILSYRSGLGKSLRKLSLSKTDVEQVIADIQSWRIQIAELQFQDSRFDATRFKSTQSLRRKYNKTLEGQGGFLQAFNDILGFRLILDQYPESFPEHFRVVDLREGKRNLDGYRAIHLYYARDNFSYPIEIQIWAGEDVNFNTWSHAYVYKYLPSSIGIALRAQYDQNPTMTEQEFVEALKKEGGK